DWVKLKKLPQDRSSWAALDRHNWDGYSRPTFLEGALKRLAAALCAIGLIFVPAVGMAQEENAPPPLPSDVHLDPLQSPPTVSESSVQEKQEGEPEKKNVCCPCPTVRVPEMFGDQGPIGSMLRLPSGQIQGPGNIFVPSARYFKISDNDSPLP